MTLVSGRSAASNTETNEASGELFRPWRNCLRLMKNGASLDCDGRLAKESVNESLSDIVLLSNTWLSVLSSRLCDTAVNSSTPAPMSTAPGGNMFL